MNDFFLILQEMELMAKVNALREITSGEQIVLCSLEKIEKIYEPISPTEYEDEQGFLNKLLHLTPLLKKGAEEKEDLEEDDFIYYQ